jgi:hypothetical protein
LLDSKKSPQDLITAGRFRAGADGATQEGDAALRDKTRNPVKNIEVTYQDNSGDPNRPKVEPDFRVKRDGTVEVLRNPDRGTGDKIVVELERQAGDRGKPPEAQQRAVDDLIGYLSGRYMNEVKNPDGSIRRDGQIKDEQGLVSDAAKRATSTQPTPEQSLPPEAREQVERVNRWRGSGGGRNGGDGGRFSPQEGREQFAPRTVPRQPGEDDKIAAIKDVASGFFSRGEREPYTTVRRRNDGGGHRVGRYGVSGDQYYNWLMGLSEEEIERLIKEGKLPKGALALRQGKNTPEAAKLKGFIDKMRAGQEAPSADEIRENMPSGAQERMGTDLVKQYAAATADQDENGNPTRVNVGKVALSFHLGRAATDEDAAQPEHQQLMQAAERTYPLALRRAMEGDVAIDLSEAGRKIVAAARGSLGQALWRNYAGATQFGNLGCAVSVSGVLRDAGVTGINDLSVVGLAGKLRREGWQAHSFAERQPGDVVIALKPGGTRGHTGVIGESRDVTYHNSSGSRRWEQANSSMWQSRRWPTVYVLRPPRA